MYRLLIITTPPPPFRDRDDLFYYYAKIQHLYFLEPTQMSDMWTQELVDKCYAEQQHYAPKFGEWLNYEVDEANQMNEVVHKEIGPKSTSNADIPTSNTDKSDSDPIVQECKELAIISKHKAEENEKRVKRVVEAIKECCRQGNAPNGTIVFSRVMLHLKLIPSNHVINQTIFRARFVKKVDGRMEFGVNFIDCEGRIYKKWQDLIEHNNFPPAYMVFPLNGNYPQQSISSLQLAFAFTPLCTRMSET